MRTVDEYRNALRSMIDRTNTMSVPANEELDEDLILAGCIREVQQLRVEVERLQNNVTGFASCNRARKAAEEECDQLRAEKAELEAQILYWKVKAHGKGR